MVGADNLADLIYLEEPNVLQCLDIRFQRRQVYTAVSQVHNCDNNIVLLDVALSELEMIWLSWCADIIGYESLPARAFTLHS